MENEMVQATKREVEQMGVAQEKLTDPKKWVLYGFALGLKAESIPKSITHQKIETKAAI